MKKLLLVLVGVSFAIGSLIADNITMEKKEQSSSLCVMFAEKAKFYKLNMDRDLYAEAALASYEKQARIYCSQGK